MQTDACLNNCAAAVCGDGEVRAGVEACDDGNNDDGDECRNDCSLALLGSTAGRATLSCQAIKTARPQAPTGNYWINPDGDGGVAAFEVSCDMTTEGGGWLRMRLNNSQQIVVAEWDRSNPWYKCADDEAQSYDWITQAQVTPDSTPANEQDYSVALTYLNLATNAAYSASQMTALRNQVTQLANSTRIVATTSDDDGYSRQANGGSGHEGYIRTAQGSWFLLTPGTNQECGGNQGTWPVGGSRHAEY
ncbi:MAG TPA: hypothetical protein EYP98_07365, partial [Planctomycetes bacterium]|nr:hypothetical protein [Planctomycetota bacterium]